MEDLIETISAYGELRRDDLLAYICELSARSDSAWSANDQRLGGLVTERSLEALGHIDVAFDRSPAMVFATPRLLVARPFGEPTAFFVGQRRRGIVEAIMEFDSRETVSIDRRASPPGFPCLPGRVQITASSHEELAEIAKAIHAQYIQEPPARALVEFSTTFQDYLLRLNWREEPDLNWAQRHFDVRSLLFHSFSVGTNLRLTEYKQTPLRSALYRLRDNRRTCDVHRDWGRYAVLAAANKNVLGFHDYAPNTQVGHFIAPLGALLPRIFSRAASLCSGRPPVFVRREGVRSNSPERVGFLVYPDVNKDVAILIAEKLGQKLAEAVVTSLGDLHA